MVATCSPHHHHHDVGGTLHFHSPTHIHHVDAASAIQQLRRSLSRSPSRAPAFRLVTSASTSPTPKSPLSPSPLSASKSSTNLFSAFSAHSTSPLARPFPPSAKKNRPTLRRPSPMRLSTRSRTSPKSPMKRALSDSKDNGNGSPSSPISSGSGAENRTTRSASPLGHYSVEKDSRTSASESKLAPHHALSRLERATGGGMSVKSSPLKRSDGIMNFDQAYLGSPLAKRRSMHGASFADFNIFDYGTDGSAKVDSSGSSEGPEDESSSSQSSDNHGTSPFPSPLPKRSSSLRKTTLQQRCGDKPTFAKSKPNADLHFEFPAPGQAASKARHRISVENFLPAMPRDSPFSSQGSLPNASVHVLSQTNAGSQNTSSQPAHPRHPLSRTMTQSSSNSSTADESPTHVPLHHAVHPRPTIDFSKSLPAGAVRPTRAANLSSGAASDESSFATPENYKLVKPLPAAFMSTGLISKRNKNMDEPQLGNKALMPDTPCKRPTNFTTAAVPVPGSAIGKARQVRHSFGTPSTPFNAHATKPTPGPFSKKVGIFGSSFGDASIPRRGSFASIDGDENPQSPSAQGDSQSSAEYELPPTPTKQPFGAEAVQGDATPVSGSTSWDRGTAVYTFGAIGTPQGTRGTMNGQISTPLNDVYNQLSPHTPQEGILPPDPSGLSISGHGDGHITRPGTSGTGNSSSFPPATPTASREYLVKFGGRRSSIAPFGGFANNDVDSSLTSRFQKVELIGSGEFSQVYRVAQAPVATMAHSYFSLSTTKASPKKTPLSDRVWAVKKTKQAYIGARDRQRKLQEVNILKRLGQSDHVVELIDSWEEKDHLYMQLEFCEEGGLDAFLTRTGDRGRLDDFRIWKILLELSLGVQHIHACDFMHLDLKPANVLITFEGMLKIADFGMASPWPAQPGIEGEGDREYLAPEILVGQYDKPADIFALGLIMLEIAGNVVLPDNGASWQKLRTGDISDVPSLTWTSERSSITRDDAGNPISPRDGGELDELYVSDSGEDELASPKPLRQLLLNRKPRVLQKSLSTRTGELTDPPSFMIDGNNEDSLDKIIRWMISPQPSDRPTAHRLLQTVGVQWAETRRRAGATVYEGNWGPADEISNDDTEMIDV